MSDNLNKKSASLNPVTERYSQSSNPGFEAIMALRTAAKEGAFFISHLNPGMRVLDVGCGPGSITLGFAEVVAPGEVVGVDFQPSQIEQAQALKTARGLDNVQFQVADAYQLPFPDQSFDAVFVHAVLWHLREPHRALQEIYRILRPGGFIGIRECDWGGRFHTPMTPQLENWYALTVKIRKHNGGDPFFGRQCRRILREAGFVQIAASVSSWSAGQPEELSVCAAFLKAQLKGFASTAISQGWMDQAAIDIVANEIEIWRDQPDALYVDTYFEAIGFVAR